MTISTPLDLATDGRDAMIAIGMNGEALPREHGFPARMVVPGLYGFVSATKWIARITLTTYAEQDAYWTERDWATDAPIKISSRIDTPKPLSRIDAGRHRHRRRRLGPAPRRHRRRSRSASTAAAGRRPGSARRPARTTGASGTSPGPPSPAQHTLGGPRRRAATASTQTRGPGRRRSPSGSSGIQEIVVTVRLTARSPGRIRPIRPGPGTEHQMKDTTYGRSPS